MTASDKKKTALLVLLMIVAGLSWYFFVYRPTLIPAAEASKKAAAEKKKPVKPIGDAQLHLELTDLPTNTDVGQKNLFQYRQKPQAPPKPSTSGPAFPVPVTPPVSPGPSTPPPVSAPPYRAFKYEGFSVPGKNGKILASLTESGNTYYVKEGDCLMGQYCISRITESLIEIQDILLKRPQTVPRTQQ
jgi:hypothetical protein